MRIDDRRTDRLRLKLLDGCLQQLEEAHERNHVTVPSNVAARVQPHVRTVQPGMLISEAISLVLRAQEPYLGNEVANGVVVPELAGYEEPMDEASARLLTEQIKQASRQVCMLLFDAHRRRAWIALGYSSWDEYIQCEIGLSRTRSYELLDQGRVIRAIMAAAGISGFPDISAYAAEQIKPYLAEVIEAVRERTAGASEPEALEIVSQVVRERRTLIAQERRQAEQTAMAEQARRAELTRLSQAIDRLASMPPVGDVISEVDVVDASRLARIDDALHWLTEFADECRRRRLALDREALPQENVTRA